MSITQNVRFARGGGGGGGGRYARASARVFVCVCVCARAYLHGYIAYLWASVCGKVQIERGNEKWVAASASRSHQMQWSLMYNLYTIQFWFFLSFFPPPPPPTPLPHPPSPSPTLSQKKSNCIRYETNANIVPAEQPLLTRMSVPRSWAIVSYRTWNCCIKNLICKSASGGNNPEAA